MKIAYKHRRSNKARMASAGVDKHSMVLSFVLLACVLRYLFSYGTTQHEDRAITPAIRSIVEEEEARMDKLRRASLEIGSAPIQRPQEEMAEIMASLPHDLPWYEFGNQLVAQARQRFLDDSHPPLDGEITLVSAVLNVNPQGLELPMSDLLVLLNNFMKYPQKKIVFIDETYVDEFSKHLDDQTKVVILDMDKFRGYFGSARKDAEQIIDDRTWRYLVDWLHTAPQAEFPEYILTYASQVFLLREAARLNPWDTAGFMWFDPGLNCVRPQKLTSNKMSIFNEHFDRFFMSFFTYGADQETHGFPKHAYEHFIGVEGQEHRVVKGWAFGGQLGSIELVAVLVDLVMRETLRQGHMGNADCILSIVMERFPEAIHPWNTVSACSKSKSYDRTCLGYTNPAYWCSPFEWAVEGPPDK